MLPKKIARGVGGWGLANPSFSRIFFIFLTLQDPLINTAFNWSKPGVCMDVYDNVQYEKPLKALDQSTAYTASFCRDIAMILEEAT